jgi:cell division protein FtsB
MKALAAALLVMLLILQFRLWVGEGSVAELRQLQSRVDAQQLENEQLRARNSSLETEVLNLKEGLEAVEERARNDLGMIREDETFYLVIE